mmetsp:Transcript_17409/g.54712  ORF Transcript_17409/g.54712 Transcript_17409/m.54712 type:complete len:568 (+) Transcript_17409:66-1769(+)
MSTKNMFKLKAQEITPLGYEEDAAEVLAMSKTKEELVKNLQTIGQKGEMSAMYYGYAQDVAENLNNWDPDVRASACEALGNMGQAAEMYVPEIAKLLTSDASSVRAAAASAMGMFGFSSAPHVETLKGLMSNDSDEGVRCAAVGALGQIGVEEQAGAMAELLASKSPVVVAAAVQALGQLGPAGQAQAASIAAKLDDPHVRYAAICSLLSLGEGAVSEHVDAIISKCLSDADSLTRTAAAEALGQVKPETGVKLIPKVAAYLKDDHAGVRCSAALTLGYMGQWVPEAEVLKALLDDKAEDKSELSLTIGGGSMRSPPSARRPKCAALVALGMLGVDKLAADCAECLTDDEWEVRMCALECLAQMGDAGREQSSQISTCLEDDVFVVRTKACECLGALKAEDSAHNLPDVFEDRAPSVRAAALMALAETPDVAKEYPNEVFKCMGDQTANVQAAAIVCLGSMGETGQSFASIIATKLYDDDAGVRAAACEALGKLGDHGAAFAEEVAANLSDGAPEVRMKAVRALGAMGQDGAPFCNELGFLLDDASAEVGMAAKEAMLSLEKLAINN